MQCHRSPFSVLVTLILIGQHAACGGREVVEGPVERARASVSSQDANLCAAVGNAVFKFPGGPGGDGCTCASIRGLDRATNVATLKLLLPTGSEDVRANVAKGTGLGQYHDTWVLANCP